MLLGFESAFPKYSYRVSRLCGHLVSCRLRYGGDDESHLGFIERPSADLPEEHRTHITASGTPLEVLMASLQKLRDLRTAAPRDDIRSRYQDLERIRTALGEAA